MNTVLDGRVAPVTGAGGGIGLATAFAEVGASVIVADRNEEAIGKAAEELRAAGHNAIGVTCDVTDTAQVTAMVERAVSTYGRLDAAFNNAGVNTDSAALLETGDDEFDRVMNVNLRGVWNCMKVELRQMMAQGSGTIVNCSSIGGMVGSDRATSARSRRAMMFWCIAPRYWTSRSNRSARPSCVCSWRRRRVTRTSRASWWMCTRTAGR